MATGGSRPFSEDLVDEILLPLPVESLLRFKCVSKKWYNIISSPDFIREHLKKNSKKPPQILIYDHSAPDDSPPITLISEDGAPENPPPEYFQRVRGRTHLVGSVDGLFLLEKEIDLHTCALTLWNPATREVRPLPDPNFDLKLDSSLEFLRDPETGDYNGLYNLFGFGLDPVTNDYKVIWFLCSLNERGFIPLPRPYAAVYSCSKDSWRILQPGNYYDTLIFESPFREALGTAYLNGSYYWLIKAGLFGNCSILSFDFTKEVYGHIEGPDVGPPFSHRFLFLILLDDNSIALMSEVDIHGYEIWVLIEPGLWNKLFTFKCFVASPYILSWNPSSIFFVDNNSCLVSYDVRTQEARPLRFRHSGLRSVA